MQLYTQTLMHMNIRRTTCSFLSTRDCLRTDLTNSLWSDHRFDLACQRFTSVY